MQEDVSMDVDDLRKYFERDRYASLCGVEIVEATFGSALVKLRIEDRHLNGLDMAHGGCLFTLADMAFAVASNSHGVPAVAVSASITYVKAVRSGVVFARAREVSRSRRLAVYAVEVTDEAGAVLCLFQGTVYIKA